MQLAPAVIVHSLAMARSAVAAAGGRGLTLLSAEAAACYAGVGWWRALVAAATDGGAHGGTGVRDVLDCGDAAGRALEALRAGQMLLVLRGDARLRADVAGRAARCGAVLLGRAPPALDLAKPGAARQLAAWLAADGGNGK